MQSTSNICAMAGSLLLVMLLTGTASAADRDSDGIPDATDNCTLLANPAQCDSDGDGIGNRCDADLNNNGFTNAQDGVLFRQQLGQPSNAPGYNKADLNCNGFINAQDYTIFRGLLGQLPGPYAAATGLNARPSNTMCVAPPRPTGALNVTTVDAYPAAPAFSQPVKILQAPNDPSRWFVLEKTGLIRVFSVSNPASVSTWLNFTARVNANSEGGMLGMAFHPNYPATREVFVYYTGNPGGPMVSRLSRVILDNVTSPSVTTEQVLLTVNQPFDNHNGGDIAFGNDGFLYLGLGDGGDGYDPLNSGQDTRTLLGSMLRINVQGVPYPVPGYTIPSTNPFAGNPLCGAGSNAQDCPEIYAWGFRNPWRWSFDRPTGQLW
ncbi:MAG: PQQ-dependent sugar dehydrogenase, partial [Gammaproteobacteria bacterium]